MILPTRTPPKKRGSGPKSFLTPTQEIEAWSWHYAKRELGNFKTQAAKMGVREGLLRDAVARMVERERREAQKIGRVNEKFLRELKGVAF